MSAKNKEEVVPDAASPQRSPSPSPPAAAGGGGGGGGGGGKPVERKRQVRFASAAKKHDGLRNNTDMFNEYMRDVFRLSKRAKGYTTSCILARNLNLRGLIHVQSKLSDLIRRCIRSRKGRALVLRGGGSTMSVDRQHVQYLMSHVNYLETLIAKVRTVIARRRLIRAKQQQQQQRQKEEKTD